MFSVIYSSIFLFICTLFFSYRKKRVYHLQKNKKEKCLEVLQTLQPMMAQYGFFELGVNKKTILFHTLEEEYLIRCTQILTKNISYMSKETRGQLRELQKMLHTYVRSNRCVPGEVLLSWIVTSFKNAFSNPYDVALQKQKEYLLSVGNTFTEKRFHARCKKYLQDRAFIKNYFDTLLVLLQEELRVT